MNFFYCLFAYYFIFIFNDVLCISNDDCGQISLQDNSQFPWNVGIYTENENRQLHLVCFGTLIQPNTILTVAHCLYNNAQGGARNATFYVATNNIKKIIDLRTRPTDIHMISKNNIVINKYYKGRVNLFTNDLAIIKTKFKFNDKNKPVCLDWSNTFTKDPPEFKQPIFDHNNVIIIDQLNQDSEECPYIVPKNFANFITNEKSCVKIKSSNIRLSRENEGAGVIFLNPEDNLWYIWGVLNIHDPEEGKFSTYTKINQYTNWISNVYATPII